MGFMDNATCVMCNRGVHYVAGRIGCDGCDLPTDCCLCPPTTPPENKSVAPPEPPAPPK